MEKHAFHVWRYGAPLLVLAAGAAALWPFRHQLTAEAIAAFSPRQTVLAASFLVGLYALKSLSVCFPMSALTAAGGLLFPFPLALAVNLCGTGVAQTIPFFLGRREQEGLEALAERIPRVAGVCRAQAENPWLSVFLLRLAGASPGDVVSLYLGASGTPYGTYLSAGLLGGLPRIACATVLGGALWQPGSGRFWLSLAAGGALTALSGVGRKTANLILGDVFGQPAYVCDTHCIRITGRLGLTDGSKDPLSVEKQLRQVLPPEESSDFCHRMVLFGRDRCTARKANCDGCPLRKDCDYGKAQK